MVVTAFFCISFGVYVCNSEKYLGKFTREVVGPQRHRPQLYVFSTHSLSDSEFLVPLLIDIQADPASLGFQCDDSIPVKPYRNSKTGEHKVGVQVLRSEPCFCKSHDTGVSEFLQMSEVSQSWISSILFLID